MTQSSPPPPKRDESILRLSRNALKVLEHRYLKRDDEGTIVETPAQLFRRVARAVSSVEGKWSIPESARVILEDSFYRLMVEEGFLPNSPTLMNAGRPLGMLSACFVLPLEDSIQDIMETARQIALVQRAGGGTGVDLSQLRPRGSIVRSSGGTTDGPLSFLKMLSGVTEAIQQGAFRRGANMGMMRIDHPDILEFIDIKSDLSTITNYNLSVSMTDSFMNGLRQDPGGIHVVRDPATGRTGALDKSGDSVDYGVEFTTGDVRFWSRKEIWDRIVRQAWSSGEPGLIFIDEVNRRNPTPNAFEIRATNPCGEQPLGPYEACNLGSINLDRYYRAQVGGNIHDRIDWESLRETVRTSVRFLDDVIEANRYPTPEIHDACVANRKIGLGVMGWADLLFHLGLQYDSDPALDLARHIGRFFQQTSWDMSTELAEERGCFPNWEGSTWDTRHQRKMRNAHTITIAPTGTISILAGCSGGIEPVFSLAFTRQVLNGQQLAEVNPIFESALNKLFAEDEKVRSVVEHAASRGSIQDCAELPEQMRKVFRTARDVAPEWHVRMQAAWQENTDAAVSKTINLATDATTEDVEKAFLLAYETRCKGITVYRDGSRVAQPMALSSQVVGGAQNATAAADRAERAQPIRLPEIMPCVRVRQFTPFGNMHVKISVDPRTGIEREVFAQLGKGGDLANSDLEAICRIVSLFLRSNGELERVAAQLSGIGSSLSVPTKDGRIMSLGDGLASALYKYLNAKNQFGIRAILLGEISPEQLANRTTAAPAPTSAASVGKDEVFKIKCPECNGVLAFAEGCVKCHGCGFSQC